MVANEKPSDGRLRAVLEAVPERISLHGSDGALLELLSPGAESLGDDIDDGVGRRPEDILPPRVAARVREAITAALVDQRVVTLEVTHEELGLADPSVAFEVRYAPVSGTQVVAAVREVTDSRAVSALAHQALHDPLTGLANRTLLTDRLEHALARADRRRGIVAVLLLDLDRFKNVNDTLGHDRGDHLLVAVARRLAEVVRDCDTVARLGGDEFVVLAEDSGTAGDVIALAERLIDAIDDIRFDTQGLGVTASVGVAISVEGQTDATTMLANADIAMYRAKTLGKNRVEVFDQALRDRVERRAGIEIALREALAGREFRLVFQPIIQLSTGATVAAEALLRWHRPGFGVVAPAEFLPVADETSLILPIGEQVLRSACRQSVAWREGLGIDMAVSVNLSARQLIDPTLPALVRDVVRGTGVSPTALSLEINERVLTDEPELVRESLSSLNEIGVRIAVDDFGSGFASLVYLHRLPVDQIKLDGRLTQGLTDRPRDTAVVRSTINLAHELGLSVIAEGVQTGCELESLREFGCDYAQGFHIAPPMPPNEMLGYLGAMTATDARQGPSLD